MGLTMVSARFVLRSYIWFRWTGNRSESPTFLSCKPLVATERETRNDNYNQSVRNLQAYFGRLHLFMVILPAKIFKVILTLLATEFETGNDNYN
jgi:hypothetical protein